MTNIRAELAYSYRRYFTVIADVNDDNRTLSTIEHLLVNAGQAYRDRRYQDAIDLYNQVRSLLWSQLYPLVNFDEKRAWSVDLRRSFVSYSAEWLNLLPIEHVAAGVRPREVAAIESGTLLGLHSNNVDAKGAGAVADMNLAEMLTAQGNTVSAQFFKSRAAALAPNLVKQIEAISSPPAPAAAGGAPVPASPLLRITPNRGAAGMAASPQLAPAMRKMAAPSLLLTMPANLSQLVAIPPKLTVAERTYSLNVGDRVQQVGWKAGEAPSVDVLLKNVYDARRALTVLPDVLIAPRHAADVAVSVAHMWYYESPLGLAECYHAMGSWKDAEEWYLRAANYAYINANIEAPYVWARLATLYLDWGNSLFRADDAPSALPVYEKVLTSAGQAPNSALYTIPGLAQATTAARNVIANLANPAAITASPSISSVIFDVQAQLAKISGGLDFWGHWAQNVPIWTFDYLQSVAANFCQLAISAERDAMSFWEKADSGQLTRLQLTQNVAQSKADRDAAKRQAEAAQQELGVYVDGQALAQQRAADARANANEYAAKSGAWTMHQALSAQLGGGEDGNAGELNQLADRMMQGGYSIEGARGTLTAAEQLTASRLQSQYEIDRMNREAKELDAAVAQAAQERAAAQARVTAAQASVHAADVRVAGATELLNAFDQQRFTPDVWYMLGNKMNQISQRYLMMALDVAKRMQRAYNFENDVLRTIIKPDYAADTVNGLLAADVLMADVQSFTYDLITNTKAKDQPIRQTISLAQRYPYLFETQLRATGRMEFQTNLDDFDSVYPGSYAGRVEHVEVSVDGIVPARGISGALTNSGISHYRTPSPWPVGSNGVKHRVQSRETLMLSDYDLRTDAIIVETDRRRRRIFEGAGLASSWTLELPMDVNSFDYQALVDVRLTFTYQARFDPGLRNAVLADLKSRPQAHQRQRPVPLRWLFPDAFFSFYGSGVLSFSLGRSDFAPTETDPRVVELSLLAVTTPRARAGGIVLKVSGPGQASVKATTSADGGIAASALAAIAKGGSAIGDYKIEMTAADNPGWVTNGALDLSAIDNIALILSYTFTPRA